MINPHMNDETCTMLINLTNADMSSERREDIEQQIKHSHGMMIRAGVSRMKASVSGLADREDDSTDTIIRHLDEMKSTVKKTRGELENSYVKRHQVERMDVDNLHLSRPSTALYLKTMDDDFD